MEAANNPDSRTDYRSHEDNRDNLPGRSKSSRRRSQRIIKARRRGKGRNARRGYREESNSVTEDDHDGNAEEPSEAKGEIDGRSTK